MRRTFYILTLVFLTLLGVLMLLYDKGTLHLMLCDHHTVFGDCFFSRYTRLAETVMVITVVICLFLYKAGWAAFFLVSDLLAGGIGQIFKHILHSPRPVTWYTQHYPDVTLPAIEGLPFKEWNSFPSGHTITFFCLFLVLTMIVEELFNSKLSQRVSTTLNSKLSTLNYYATPLLLFCLAALGAYSRIYLSMHFVEDIFGGIILGVGITALLSLLIPKLQKTKFWNYSLISAIINKQ